MLIPLDSDEIIKRSLEISFGILVLILNVSEIIIITKLKRKKRIYEIFILSLSVTDLLFGIMIFNIFNKS